MRVYMDWPWSRHVREFGAPSRAYIHTKKYMWIVGVPAQAWSKRWGYYTPDGEINMKFRPITRHPHRKFLCKEKPCSRLLNHEGPHNP